MDTTLDLLAGLLIELIVIILCDFGEHIDALVDHVLLEDTRNRTGDVEWQTLGILMGTKLDALAGLLIDLLVIILRYFGEHLEALLDHVLLEDTNNITGYVELQILGIIVGTTLALAELLLELLLRHVGKHRGTLLVHVVLVAHPVTDETAALEIRVYCLFDPAAAVADEPVAAKARGTSNDSYTNTATAKRHRQTQKDRARRSRSVKQRRRGKPAP